VLQFVMSVAQETFTGSLRNVIES